MVAAFEGWNDAGDAASGAVAWLRGRWRAKRWPPSTGGVLRLPGLAPPGSLVDGVTRQISWPANEVFSAQIEEVGRDVVLLSGVGAQPAVEDVLRHRLDVARETGCEMVVTLGALLADVPHTRPIRLTGTAADPELIERLGLSHSRYEGPTGIVGVLHDACRGPASRRCRCGLPSPTTSPAHPTPRPPGP